MLKDIPFPFGDILKRDKGLSSGKEGLSVGLELQESINPVSIGRFAVAEKRGKTEKKVAHSCSWRGIFAKSAASGKWVGWRQHG